MICLSYKEKSFFTSMYGSGLWVFTYYILKYNSNMHTLMQGLKPHVYFSSDCMVSPHSYTGKATGKLGN